MEGACHEFLSYDSRSNEKVNSGQNKVIWINHDNFKKWPRFGEVIEPFTDQWLSRKSHFHPKIIFFSTEILNYKNISLV